MMKENGKLFADFSLVNNYVNGGILFPHKYIHKLTWNSPDGHTNNQIDHIAIGGKWQISLQKVRVLCGADVYSDHHLVIATIKLKLQSVEKQNSCHRKHFDITKLTGQD